MKIFKTKNKHNVALARQIINTTVFLKISKLEIDENGVIPHGYYFIYHNEKPEKLDDIVPSILFWQQIKAIELKLSDFQTNSLQNAIYQRAEEFALLKLQQEGTANYGIEPSEWEELVENQ